MGAGGEVGKQVAQVAGRTNLKHVSLELGGRSPNVVLDDADVAAAIAGSAQGIFFNQGEVCTAASRLFIYENLFDRVTGYRAEEGAHTMTGGSAIGGPATSSNRRCSSTRPQTGGSSRRRSSGRSSPRCRSPTSTSPPGSRHRPSSRGIIRPNGTLGRAPRGRAHKAAHPVLAGGAPETCTTADAA